jgi:SAM-dependent methyltransferase
MDHADHIFLLAQGIKSPGGVWAELGSGDGAFTKALIELTGRDTLIYSVDKDRRALAAQERAILARFSTQLPEIIYLHADYTSSLDLPSLDGLLMANSLHFQKDQLSVLRKAFAYLRPGGRMILVEYNSDRGNRWVPFPISFDSWDLQASQAGFRNTRLLARVPSSFMGEIYSAISYKIDNLDR